MGLVMRFELDMIFGYLIKILVRKVDTCEWKR